MFKFIKYRCYFIRKFILEYKDVIVCLKWELKENIMVVVYWGCYVKILVVWINVDKFVWDWIIFFKYSFD